jgi:hypothetical protein
VETANLLNKDQRVRLGMRAFLEEQRQKPLAEMAGTFVDERLGVTYNSVVAPVSLTMTSGDSLSDLYELKVSATYTEKSEQREDHVEVYVYQQAH